MTARFGLALFLLAAALGVALFFSAFRSAWAFDDFEYINSSAQVLAGKLPLRTALLAAHDEHFVPAYRLILLGYLKAFGLQVFWWRVFGVLAYALSGVFVAMIAVRYSASRRAGVAAAFAFVAPCGFSSMWVWFSSGAAVPMAFAFLAAACATVAWRDRLRVRRIAAGVLVLCGLMTWSVFAPLALLPAIFDEIERRRDGAKRFVGAFALFCIAAMLFMLLVPLRAINANHQIDLVRAAPRAIFLAGVAPFRLFFPGVNIASGAALGLTIAALVLALLVRLRMPRLARIALLTTIPPLLYFCFVAAGRSAIPFTELYKSDRYFFPLLMPAALIAGALAAAIPITRLGAMALIAFAAFELGIHRHAFLRSVPHDVYDMHSARITSIERLAARLERAGPIAIPGNIFFFEDLHSHFDPAVLTHLLSDGKRIRLGGPIDATRLNAQLDAWARDGGEPVPFLRVVHGHLVNLRFTTTVDFSVASFDWLVASGFGEWQKPYRWMTRRGELDVMLAPGPITVRLAAPVTPARVRITLVDEAWGGYTAPLGTIEITEPGVHTYRIPENVVISKVGLGRLVRIVLECDRPPIQVYAFGTDFYGDTGATVRRKPEN